jgi:DUF1680 family protein
MMELALYNGAISGLSLGGDRFFYDNPLASRGDHQRWEWHDCPCCPPNIARLVASLGSYACSAGDGEAALHLYIASTVHARCGARDLTLRIDTGYPWDGRITIAVDTDARAPLVLRLRIPGWCRAATVSVNGARIADQRAAERNYVRIERTWQKGDTVRVDLEMPVERIYANPAVSEDAGRVALKRGPLVYCLEAVDNSVPLHRIALPRDSRLDARFETDLLGGVAVITGDAVATDAATWENRLYGPVSPKTLPYVLAAIPYYAWNHRAPGAMQVWLRET